MPKLTYLEALKLSERAGPVGNEGERKGEDVMVVREDEGDVVSSSEAVLIEAPLPRTTHG